MKLFNPFIVLFFWVGFWAKVMAQRAPDIEWDITYDRGQTEIVNDLAVSTDRFIYEAGISGKDALLIKYDLEGNVVWERTIDVQGSNDGFYGVATFNGTVYGAGYSHNGTDLDFLLIKYDQLGNPVWELIYDKGSDEEAMDVDVSMDGFVYIAGYYNNGTDWDAILIKCDENGNYEWERTYSGGTNIALGVSVSPDNYVYVAGISGDGTNWNLFLVKLDGNGNTLWESSYPVEPYYFSWVYDDVFHITVDMAGFIYISRWNYNGSDYDALIIKYDPEGNMVWLTEYDRGAYEQARGIDVDEDGFLYVAGKYEDPSNTDVLTIKYRQFFSISGFISEAGAGVSGVEVSLTGHLTDSYMTGPDGYYEFLNLPGGEDYTVTPHKPGYAFIPSSHTYSPLNYDRFEQNFSATGVEEKQDNEITLDISLVSSVMVISYEVPKDGYVEISMYDVSGCRVKKIVSEYKKAGVYKERLSLNGYGVYFLKSKINKKEMVKKIVAVKRL